MSASFNYKYPFLGIGHRLTHDDINVLYDVASNSSTYTQGPFQAEFEHKFSNQFGHTCALATSNAVSAIELIAEYLNLSSDDEIICPAHTYCASAYPFIKRGVKIIWVDIDPNQWVSNFEQVLPAITSKTKAIIAVHLYGLPCDLSAHINFFKDRNIVLIEDCAQALDATIDNNFVGTQCDFSIFSFQSHKNISTLGEGGMLCFKDSDLLNTFKMLRHNGHCPYEIHLDKYWKPAMSNVCDPLDNGYVANFCMNEFQAAIGVRLLDCLADIRNRRELNYLSVSKLLLNHPLISFQAVPSNRVSSYHLLPLYINLDIDSIDSLFFDMASQYRIQLAKQYQPLYRYPYFCKNTHALSSNFCLSHTDDFYDHMISIPFHDELSESDFIYICSSLLKLLDVYL